MRCDAINRSERNDRKLHCHCNNVTEWTICLQTGGGARRWWHWQGRANWGVELPLITAISHLVIVLSWGTFNPPPPTGPLPVLKNGSSDLKPLKLWLLRTSVGYLLLERNEPSSPLKSTCKHHRRDATYGWVLFQIIQEWKFKPEGGGVYASFLNMLFGIFLLYFLFVFINFLFRVSIFHWNHRSVPANLIKLRLLHVRFYTHYEVTLSRM